MRNETMNDNIRPIFLGLSYKQQDAAMCDEVCVKDPFQWKLLTELCDVFVRCWRYDTAG